MRKLCIATLLLLTAAVSFAQAPKPYIEGPRSDLFIGFAVNIPDYDPGGILPGFQVGYMRSHSDRWGLTLDGGVTTLNSSAHQWQLTAGPRINLLTGRFRPYVTGQAGMSNQDSDQLHPGNPQAAKIHLKDYWTARLAVGADYQLSRRVYWRIGQYAGQPILWRRHNTGLFQDFTTGFGIRF